jgi:hypothetical protein
MTTQTSAPLAWRSRNSWRSPMPRLRRSTLLGLGLRALVHEVEHRAPHHLGRRVAEHARHLLVDQRGPAVLVDGPHALERGLEQLPQADLAVDQRAFGAGALDLGSGATGGGAEQRVEPGDLRAADPIERDDHADRLAVDRDDRHTEVRLDAQLDQHRVRGEVPLDLRGVLAGAPAEHARARRADQLVRRQLAGAPVDPRRRDGDAVGRGQLADERDPGIEQLGHRAGQRREELGAGVARGVLQQPEQAVVDGRGRGHARA